MPFELLEHPADIGFHAEAATLQQLFAECARALQFIIFEPFETEHNTHIQLNAEGSDYESLLVNWLNEVLYYVDTQRLAFDSFQFEFLEETRVRCAAIGERRELLEHPVKLIVKAVTYHQLRVTKSEKLWLADVYLDV